MFHKQVSTTPGDAPPYEQGGRPSEEHHSMLPTHSTRIGHQSQHHSSTSSDDGTHTETPQVPNQDPHIDPRGQVQDPEQHESPAQTHHYHGHEAPSPASFSLQTLNPAHMQALQLIVSNSEPEPSQCDDVARGASALRLRRWFLDSHDRDSHIDTHEPSSSCQADAPAHLGYTQTAVSPPMGELSVESFHHDYTHFDNTRAAAFTDSESREQNQPQISEPSPFPVLATTPPPLLALTPSSTSESAPSSMLASAPSPMSATSTSTDCADAFQDDTASTSTNHADARGGDVSQAESASGSTAPHVEPKRGWRDGFFTCGLCKRVFTRKGYLDRHMLTIHIEDRKCVQCDNAYTQSKAPRRRGDKYRFCRCGRRQYVTALANFKQEDASAQVLKLDASAQALKLPTQVSGIKIYDEKWVLTDTEETAKQCEVYIPADGKIVFEKIHCCKRVRTFWSEGQLVELQSSRGEIQEGNDLVIDLEIMRQERGIPLSRMRFLNFVFLGTDNVETGVFGRVQVDEVERRTIFY